MAYTVTQAADHLKVSRQTIYNRLKDLPSSVKGLTFKTEGVTYVSEEGLQQLGKLLGIELTDKQIEPPINADNVELSTALQGLQREYIDSLNRQIETLKGELSERNRQIETFLDQNKNYQVLIGKKDEKILLLEDRLEKKKRPWWKWWE